MKPLILVSNDDGFDAEGLSALVAALEPLAEIIVVAPESNCSGASRSLTLRRPVPIRAVAPGRWALDGTPTDCVNLGWHRLCPHPPDLVVTGINAGLNVGEDINYSGTVAAAMEGVQLGRPALAVSMDRSQGGPWTPAQRVAHGLAHEILRRGLPRDTMLNVNVPAGDPRGLRLTTQARRLVLPDRLAAGGPVDGQAYTVRESREARAASATSDLGAVREGVISVTPLRLDLTHHQALLELENWDLPAL